MREATAKFQQKIVDEIESTVFQWAKQYDFKKYGRDYIILTYIAPGYYEADFSKG